MSSNLLTDTYKYVKRSHLPNNKKANVKVPAEDDGETQSDMNLLKQFDLNWEFGPCTGISRLERWERAQKHGLNPPAEVKDLINLHPNDESYTKSLWNGYDL